MTFQTVAFADATKALKNDAAYARNIFNGATALRPTDGLSAALHEINPQAFVVEITDRDGEQVGFLAWEWITIRSVALAAMPQGFRVSVSPCAPGFTVQDGEATLERSNRGFPGEAKAVSYDEWLAAHNGGRNGHCPVSDIKAPYTVEAWVTGF